MTNMTNMTGMTDGTYMAAAGDRAGLLPLEQMPLDQMQMEQAQAQPGLEPGMHPSIHPGWLAMPELACGAAAQVAEPAAESRSDGAPQDEHVRCATQGCAGRGRYHFAGQHACSRACLQALLRGAVLEEQALAAAIALNAVPRVQLGRILIAQGTIDEAQLEQALRSQRATGAGRLGCWLRQQMELPEQEFTAALSIQWSCPVFRTGTFAPARMASYLPRPLAEEQGVLPLRLTGSPARLSLCFEDHVDYQLMSAVERMHGIHVEAGLLTASDFWAATRELLSVPFPRLAAVEACSTEGMIEAMSGFLVEAGAAEARMVAVHGCYWLRTWTAARGGARELVERDVLCTPAAGAMRHGSGYAGEVEALTAKMLRVLEGAR